MKRFFVIFMMLSVNLSLAFAGNESVRIHGNVKDNNGKPVENAIVTWMGTPENKMIANALSDSTGAFTAKVENSVEGNSIVVVSCIGYKSDTIVVTRDNMLNIKATLHETTHNLNGVIVTAKSTIKGTPGGFSFTPGGAELLLPNGYQLLGVAPTLYVSGSSIQILGKGDAIIYINGKDPHMPNSMIMQMLSQTPPKDIERIDIISTLGSSQSAAEDRGMVNIVMKRPDYGWRGIVDLGIHYKKENFSEYPSLYLGYSHGRIRSSTSIDCNIDDELYKERKIYNYKEEKLKVVNTSQKKEKAYIFSLNESFNYDITDKSTLGAVFMFRALKNNTTNTINTSITDLVTNTEQKGRSETTTKIPWRTPYQIYGGLFYNATISKLGSTVDLDVSYFNMSTRQHDLTSVEQEFDMEGWLSDPYKFDGSSKRYGIEANAKFKHVFRDRSFLLYGVKYSYSNINDDFKYKNYIDGNYINDEKRTDHFLYNEGVGAFYAEYNRSWSKVLTTQAGIRGELTHLEGKQLTNNQSFDDTYFNIVPTVQISLNMANNNHIINASYSPTLFRPSYRSLNPAGYWTSVNTYTSGNSHQRATLSNYVSLSYRFLRDYSIKISDSFDKNNKSRYTTTDGNGITKEVVGDMGSSNRLSVTVNVDKSLFGGMWYISGYVSTMNIRANSKNPEFPIDVNSWNFSGALSNTVYMNKARNMYFSCYYYAYSAWKTAKENRNAVSGLSLSISKDFKWNGTLMANYLVSFPAHKTSYYDSSIYGIKTKGLTSSVTFGVTYRQYFGKKMVRNTNSGAQNSNTSRL